MQFNEIPAGIRVPGQYAEFAAAAKAGLSALNYKVLQIAQGTDAGSKTAATLHLVSNADQAGEYFGVGSQLHLAAIKHFQNNINNELWQIAVSMDPVATPTNKAAGSVQFTAAATANGTYVLYIAGQRIALTVTSGDAVADLADNLAAEIAANHPNLPVTSTSDTVDTVDFEARNLGEPGDSIDIRENHNIGEKLPAGVATTITAMTGGASSPALTSVIAALADTWFQIWVAPYIDATNLAALDTELDRRFGPTVQIDGVLFLCNDDTYSNLITFGSAKNSKNYSVIGVNAYLEQPFEIAAATAGRVAAHLALGNGNESKPFQTGQLIGITAPADSAVFTFAEADALLKNGIATIRPDDGGAVRIERLITTWQTNAQSAPNTTWLDVNTRFTAMYIRWDWVVYLLSKYGQAKLASNSQRIGPGQKVLTPAIGEAEALARFALWESIALVENIDFFKANLIAQRDVQDVNAFNWFLPTDLVNQFRVGKTQIEITL